MEAPAVEAVVTEALAVSFRDQHLTLIELECL